MHVILSTMHVLLLLPGVPVCELGCLVRRSLLFNKHPIWRARNRGRLLIEIMAGSSARRAGLSLRDAAMRLSDAERICERDHGDPGPVLQRAYI
ncbi:hypothetical protein C8Q72DRAFT_211278 [Fomitopsis betulina]|nr:hypothetical protein C8Q72DRAFT_211278 [Fomitopsis betulina]